MSYCRWSSDNMRSDVYAYEDCAGGYTIHVRGVHPVNPEILPDNPKTNKPQDFIDYMVKRKEIIGDLVYEDIGLPYNDETISCYDLYDLKEKLEYLGQLGYYVPNVAFEMIDGEIENVPVEGFKDE